MSHDSESPSLRLARYLREFVGLRSKVVQYVDQYDRVLWLNDMPQERDCWSGAWTDDSADSGILLEVRRQQFQAAPTPPKSILDWIDDQALQTPSTVAPPLKPFILLPDEKGEPGDDFPLVKKYLQEYPQIPPLYERYKTSWIVWAEEQLRRRKIQDVYGSLFRLYTEQSKLGEIVEVVLGMGLLQIQGDGQQSRTAVRRHSFVANIELAFDPEKGEIRIQVPGEGTSLRIEDEMLDAHFRPEPAEYEVVREQLKRIGDSVWDRSLMRPALLSWCHALDPDATFDDGLDPNCHGSSDIRICFAPALILRKRSQTGMVRIYEELICQLSDGSQDAPRGWLGLVEDLAIQDETGSSTTDVSASRAAADDPFFPLPANSEQRRIVEALNRNRGVLVQGPPGTGKSHTIANLICHLLATGQRVLVTAETGRALQVLKNKLPEEIQPLCVSLLGQGGDSLSELDKAVQGISVRQAAFNPTETQKRIEDTDKDLDAHRRELARIDHELGDLRKGETLPHAIADGAYVGTASSIATRVAEERERFSWIGLPRGTEETCPFDGEDLLRWLDAYRTLDGAQVKEVARPRPVSFRLPTPTDFAEAVSDEQAIAREVQLLQQLLDHPAATSLKKHGLEILPEIQGQLRSFATQHLRLLQKADWLAPALEDMFREQGSKWQQLLLLSQTALTHVEELLDKQGNRIVAVPLSRVNRQVRADADRVINHLNTGGNWKTLGLFTPAVLKDKLYLRDQVTVDGSGAVDITALQVLCDHLDALHELNMLASNWGFSRLNPTQSDPRLLVADLRDRMAMLMEAVQLVESSTQLGLRLQSLDPPVLIPAWSANEANHWCELIAAVLTEYRLRDARKVFLESMLVIAKTRPLHDAHPVVEAIAQAVETRDVSAYSVCFDRIVALERLREQIDERDRFSVRFQKALPEQFQAARESHQDPQWAERFRNWKDAWSWAIANRWLEKRSDRVYHEKLWEKRKELERKIQQLVARGAALRAWMHFFSRLTPSESAALRGWQNAMHSLGKGTGKSGRTERIRREAREYMDDCRQAIPIWIMPKYLVAEMVDPAPGRYDLVIVDEASQLGVDSLFLFYISKKMIVVGDDQQISPYGVGINDMDVAGLQHHFLKGIKHKHALDPQSSLYANAKIRFDQPIVLREHFRCMPEIIQFCNDLCYAPEGSPLDPLRSYPPNRLQPLVLCPVAEGYRRGSSQNATNPPEADAIVAQIVACIQDPRYANKTMGVISLQGEAQARLIEQRLDQALQPEEIQARRLICGDSYAFQGDERQIIFLSMVAAPGDTRIGSLADKSARQRFNVAVSRAQDQIWLFHSAELADLSGTCMRHRLLSYFLNPARLRTEEEEQAFDSQFEREVYRILTTKGYRVRTQVCVGDKSNRYRIDLVVEGMQGQLAVECDGEFWHGPERYEADMARQRDLERAGWRFVRIRGGDFFRDRVSALQPLWKDLDRLGILPGGIDIQAAAPPPPAPIGATTAPPLELAAEIPLSTKFDRQAASIPGQSAPVQEVLPRPTRRPTQQTVTRSLLENSDPAEDDATPLFSAAGTVQAARPETTPDTVSPRLYLQFQGSAGPDPRTATAAQVAFGLRKIVSIEGPILAKRACDIYLRSCGVRRMGHEIANSMTKALESAIRSKYFVSVDESGSRELMQTFLRLEDTPPVVIRDLGDRDITEIPPSELQQVGEELLHAKCLIRGSEEHMRAVLDFYGLKRLTMNTARILKEIIEASDIES